jgi:hypothetical protein
MESRGTAPERCTQLRTWLLETQYPRGERGDAGLERTPPSTDQSTAGSRDGAERSAAVPHHPEEHRMATSSAAPSRSSSDHTDRGTVRRSTETKAAVKTTELIAYVVAVVGVLIAALVVDEANAGGFGAKQAWLYVTILTVGYMVSRGLAKSGSRDPYTAKRDDER